MVHRAWFGHPVLVPYALLVGFTSAVAGLAQSLLG